jgi:DNA-binding protein
MKAKVNVPLKNHLGEKEYVSHVLEILNESPPVVKSKGRGRKPKPKPPVWGNLEMIRYRFRKEKELDIVELTMYTNKKKHKKLLNFATLA